MTRSVAAWFAELDRKSWPGLLVDRGHRVAMQSIVVTSGDAACLVPGLDVGV